jgi:23S rRNA (cytidine1920-2'-O)/16S rRNA (cytidine1409-2'-O)-methyltransferase
VRRGLAPSREQAQEAIASGRVTVAGAPATKAARLVAAGEPITLSGPGPRFVSRGGEKLDAALEAWAIDVRAKRVLDAGASTGGFTDCLRQRGADPVIAVDVGHGQLHPKIRDDPRVVVLERTNARALTDLPFAPQLIVCDVSFISVKTALPPALELAAPGWQGLVLVKPQFEAGRADVAKGSGVVRDPEIRRRVLREIAYAALGWKAEVAGVVDSGLPGPKGNREFFLHLKHAEDPKLPDDLDEQIDRAVAAR